MSSTRREDDVRSFKDAVTANTKLSQLGFSFACFEEVAETSVLERAYRITLTSSAARRLEFDFMPLGDGREICRLVVRNIETEDHFTLQGWVTFCGITPQRDPFKVSSYQGATFAERFASFMAFVEQQLSHDLLARIVEGDVWQEIPFDWCGLK